MGKRDQLVKTYYYIVPPISPWDEDNRLEIYTLNLASTLSGTPANAWAKFLRSYVHTDKDYSQKVQWWHDRGYRVKTCKVIIEDSEDGKA